jgi:hypothetical protein
VREPKKTQSGKVKSIQTHIKIIENFHEVFDDWDWLVGITYYGWKSLMVSAMLLSLLVCNNTPALN